MLRALNSKPQSGSVALTIAGHDPSSGAGVTADLAVFAAHGLFGTSAITALTVQSTVGVRQVHPTAGGVLQQVMECLCEDLPPGGIKIGMLAGEEQVQAVSRLLRSLVAAGTKPVVVVDPVLRSTSGSSLLSQPGLHSLMTDLLPLADFVTPNTVELSAMTGMETGSPSAIASAAGELLQRYPRLAVLVTGGHRQRPDDVLFSGGVSTVLPGERVETTSTHGTGCAQSSALLCNLIAGQSPLEAARNAKAYVAQALQRAIPRGSGHGPLQLLWPLEPKP